MLAPFGDGVWTAEGPVVSFLGFPYPTRMAVVRLTNGSLWVWSPIELTPPLREALATLGPVRFLIAPNKLHHLFIGPWREAWPEAAVYVAPGLVARRPDLRAAGELGDAPEPGWEDDIDQLVFRGSFAMEEVVFFHRRSRTAIVTDLIQRHDPAQATGWRGWLMRANDLVGPGGSTPREWRLTFVRRRAARGALDRVLAWQPEQLIVAHGACARHGASDLIARSLAWIGR